MSTPSTYLSGVPGMQPQPGVDPSQPRQPAQIPPSAPQPQQRKPPPTTMLRPAAAPVPPPKPPGQTTAGGLPALNAGYLEPMIQRSAQTYGISPDLLRAVIWTESGFKPNAVGRPVKGQGTAKGLGQLMDATARQYGVDRPFDAQQNLDGAAHYLSDLQDQYGGDLRKVLGAYSGNPNRDPSDINAYFTKVTSRMGPGGVNPEQAAVDPSGIQAASDKLIAAHKAYMNDKSTENRKAFLAASDAYDAAKGRQEHPEGAGRTIEPIAPYGPLPFWQRTWISRLGPAGRAKQLQQWYPGSRIVNDDRPGAAEDKFLLVPGQGGQPDRQFSIEPGFWAGTVAGNIPQVAAGTAGAAGMIAATAPAGVATAGGESAIAGTSGYAMGAGAEQAGEEAIKRGLGLQEPGRTPAQQAAAQRQAEAYGAPPGVARVAAAMPPDVQNIATATGMGATGYLGGLAMGELGSFVRGPALRLITGAKKETIAEQAEVVAAGGSLPFKTALPHLTKPLWWMALADRIVGKTSTQYERAKTFVRVASDNVMKNAGVPETERATVTSRLFSSKTFDTDDLGKAIQADAQRLVTEAPEAAARRRVVGTGEAARLKMVKEAAPAVEETRERQLINQLSNEARKSPEDAVAFVLREGKASDLETLSKVLSPDTMAMVRQAALRKTLMGVMEAEPEATKPVFRGKIRAALDKYTDKQRAILFPNGMDTDLYKLGDRIDKVFPEAANVGAAGLKAGEEQSKPLLKRLPLMMTVGIFRWLVDRPAVITRLVDGLEGDPMVRAATDQSIKQLIRFQAAEAAKELSLSQAQGEADTLEARQRRMISGGARTPLDVRKRE